MSPPPKKPPTVKLFCPICGKQFDYSWRQVGPWYHHREFGILDSGGCFERAEIKYTRMILRKGDED